MASQLALGKGMELKFERNVWDLVPAAPPTSSLATRLAANENSSFFPSMVKSKPGDISIVDKPGTLLLWYDSPKKTT